MQIEVDFVPKGANLRAFLQSLAKQLKALGLDTSAFDVDQIAKDFEEAAFFAGEAGKKISELEAELDSLQSGGDKAAKTFERLGKFGALEGIGSGLNAFNDKLQQNAEGMRLLGLRSGATGAELEQLEQSASNVFSRSVGFETFNEATEAIGVAHRTLSEFLDPAQLEDFVVNMSGAAKAFDQDLNNALLKSTSLIKAYGSEAANVIPLVMQQAGTSGDDVLDTLAEYAPLMKEAGISYEEFAGRMIAGAQAGARDTDKLADSIKEMQIRLQAGDTTKALSEIDTPITEAIAGIVKAGEEGSKSAGQVMSETAQAIETAFDAGQISETMRSQLQVAIAGTPAEDLGADLYADIFTAPIDPSIIQGQAADLTAMLQESIQPPSFTETIGRELEATFSGLGATIGPLLGPTAQFAQTLGTVGPALAGMDLAKHAGSATQFAASILSKVIPGLGAQLAATNATTIGTKALSAALLTNPFFLGGAAILAGVAAAFVLLRDNTKSADDAVADLNESTDRFNEVTEKAKGVKTASDNLRKLADEYDDLSKKTDPESQKRFAQVATELDSKLPGFSTKVDELGTKGELLGQKYQFATGQVRAHADEMDRLADQGVADAQKMQTDQVKAALDTWDKLEGEIAGAREETDKYQALVDQGLGDEGGGIFSDTYAENAADSRAELVKYGQEQEKVKEGLKDWIKEQAAQGKSMEDVAEAAGRSVEDIAYLGGEMFAAQKEAAAIGGEMRNVAQETRATADEAKKLGAEFQAAMAASADLSTASIAALAQALFNLENTKNADAETRALLQKQVDDLTVRAQSAVKSETELQAYLKRAEKLAGKVTRTTTRTQTEREKRLIDAKDVVDDIIKSLNNELTLQGLSDGLDRELSEVFQDREADLAALKEQAEKLREDYKKSLKKDSGLIFKNADLIKSLEEGGEAYKKVLEKYANIEREVTINFFRETLAQKREEQEKENEKLAADYERQAGQIAAIDATSIAKRIGLLSKANALEFENRRRSIVENNEALLSLMAEQAKEQRNVDTAETESARDAAKIRVDELTKQIEAQKALIQSSASEMFRLRDLNEKLSTDLTDTEKKETEEQITIINEKLATIDESTRSAAQDLLYAQVEYADEERGIYKELSEFTRKERVDKLIKENMAREAEMQRHNDEMSRLVGVIVSVTEARGDRLIGIQERQALEQLEETRARDIISEEEYERRKTEIASAAELDREALRSRARGIELEAERQAVLQQLAAERESTQALLDEAIAAGDVTEADNLRDKLKGIEDDIKERGKFITAVAAELQDALTELFTNLVAGDEEDIKRPFKKAFGVLVGALQRLASAKITEVLLGSISGVLGLPGLVGSLAAKGVIEGIVNSLLNPIFSSLTSFAEGSGPLTSPQLAIVGDAPVPERVLRDDQLQLLMTAASARGAEMLLPQLQTLIQLFREYPDRIAISEGETADAVNRANQRRRKGLVG